MTHPYLTLDDLRTDSALVRLLPRDLACRLHAVPVAEDGGRLTVAMANPDDIAARSVLAQVLGTPPFVVRCDQAVIDAVLSEMWADTAQLHLTAYAPSLSAGEELSDAARLVGELLRSRVTFAEVVRDDEPDLDEVGAGMLGAGCDLVMCARSCQPLIDRLFLGAGDSRIADRIPTSLLILQRFRWPLKRVLMIVSQDSMQSNEAALRWAERFARPSGSLVTALAVVPPLSTSEDRTAGLRLGLATLLDTDTFLGRELRRIGARLAEPGIDGRLRLRQGPPGWQLRLEMATGEYDLIIVGADKNDRWLRWISGGQIGAFLRWADRPVLIAKPTPRERTCIRP